MSRIGKNPVAVPSGVEVQLSGRTLSAKGALGMLQLAVSNEVTASIADGMVTIAPNSETKHARAMWGTTRALINNMVTGVSKGFSITPRNQRRRLPGGGSGRYAQSAARLQPRRRFSDPRGRQDRLRAADAITVSGADRQRVGQIAAEIRAYRPPEPYKGKGIKYSTEIVRRKEGKKK